VYDADGTTNASNSTAYSSKGRSWKAKHDELRGSSESLRGHSAWLAFKSKELHEDDSNRICVILEQPI
jgi:hypothetical protein